MLPGDLPSEKSPQRYRLLAEVKWSDHNTLSHSLWDAAKLLATLVDRSDSVYLISGWPTKIWNQVACAKLYGPGTVNFRQLAELPGEWPSLLKHSQGTPQMLPTTMAVRQIANIAVIRHDPVTDKDEEWQLRAVVLEPASEDWIWLNRGHLEGAIPLREHDHAALDRQNAPDDAESADAD